MRIHRHDLLAIRCVVGFNGAVNRCDLDQLRSVGVDDAVWDIPLRSTSATPPVT
jgi:ketosteroid isomerase-like protein